MRVRGSTSAHDNQLIIALCLLLLIWHYTPVEGIPDRRGGEDGPAADPVWGWEERENGGGDSKGGGGGLPHQKIHCGEWQALT